MLVSNSASSRKPFLLLQDYNHPVPPWHFFPLRLLSSLFLYFLWYSPGSITPCLHTLHSSLLDFSTSWEYVDNWHFVKQYCTYNYIRNVPISWVRDIDSWSISKSQVVSLYIASVSITFELNTQMKWYWGEPFFLNFVLIHRTYSWLCNIPYSK